MAELLKGKPIADKIKEDLKKEIEGLKSKTGSSPKLVAVQIGENASSAVYLKAQKNTAESLGIEYILNNLSENTKQDEAEKLIDTLNKDKAVSAIILQLPVPKQIDAKKLVNLISPIKDAEGMHPGNLGQVLLGNWKLAPCTASACMALIESTGINLYGKEAVIVGHSEIVGKPLSLMLLSKFATTTVCHIATGERGVLPEHVKRAEVLVVAVGKAGLIKGEWVKRGSIVIDVGINKVGDTIVGDVEFDKASQQAAYITPVPGGVGPLTTTMLMKNTVEAFKAQKVK
ncbi:MAG: bifunctional 5,10-methylenetetrahydrofolate dehydrogenase/5,10-methenyltetrahydrofolate cyclohydrolase [Candidatus Omnitrophica bacterium]|nr:bifunctional 5,10-methylenetetrahydrofolate dehydrogenase/5,10-methenyltetrahydrofolate cyclohydrolase [Candidatus Omnitrophota bacterium]MDD5351886.1 bifunctional 5,10-methylenetetrahydrofolate dehydrogenase/5,10-methenyltetrahydrofolate cyclohydrolase [Candidatus Omnitrophota bacterium]MDD5550712.1 bifunctional 5,10-methylenetetrahydrofolate dehydrogenase/5,10-methenyltetrahydrofolate cyclohydrolase [Candidatus Omnitrophota bacterium]